MIFQSEQEVVQNYSITMLDVDFWYYCFLFSVLALWVFFGLQFFFKGLREKENVAQRSYQMGFGVFITLAVVLEALFVVAMFYSDYLGIELFRGDSDYGIDSVVYDDFFVLTPAVMFGSLAFLQLPIEKYMMKKKRPVIAYANLILSPFPFLIRYIETHLEGWTGMELDGKSIAYFGMTFVWYLLFGFAFLSILLVIALYARMSKAAPKGSKLKHKCWAVIVGLLLWATGLFSTGESHNRIWYWHVPQWAALGYIWFLWTPMLLVISLILLTSGFSREY
ncbi:MAG: hypothetical protein ACTSU5_15220 [Promethearchaeota archaeon]